MASTKLPTSKNVIYDSKKDTATGRKRAVEFTGGVSVAERARLFGAQVGHSSTKTNPQTQQFPITKQPTKSNVVHDDRNYQPYKTATNRRPQQNTNHSSPERVARDYRPAPMQINDRSKHPSSASNNSHNYSTTFRPSRQQRTPSPDNYIRSKIPNEQPTIKTNYTQVLAGDAYIYDDNSYYQTRQQNSNYFQPIQDPLRVLYQSSAQNYSQQQMPTMTNNTDSMHAFDLSNLINRIQQDYVNNARPYVSSIQFIENEQDLANIGIITPSTNRRDYMRRSTNDVYLRRGETYHYDIIDTKDLHPRYAKATLDENPYSSMKRRRPYRRRFHDQASSPINIQDSTTKSKPPETPIEKPPTPVVAEEEEEEEDATTANTKTEEVETSSESEEESITTPAKASTEPVTGTPVTTRPPLPNQTPTTAIRTPAKPVASETSETEESDSDSDSDSDDEEEEKVKPKPSPVVRLNNVRNTPTTPQSNIRTPQSNIRTPQSRPINTKTNQPPDVPDSTESFDLQTSKRSSSIGGKLKSLTNKFRRKTS